MIEICNLYTYIFGWGGWYMSSPIPCFEIGHWHFCLRGPPCRAWHINKALQAVCDSLMESISKAPQERMMSDGKIYSGSKIKEVPQCPISFSLTTENQGQTYNQCPELLCHGRAKFIPASGWLSCVFRGKPLGVCIWNPQGRWPHSC